MDIHASSEAASKIDQLYDSVGNWFWDLLLLECFVPDEESESSPRAIFRKTINYSKNYYLEQLLRGINVSKIYDQMDISAVCRANVACYAGRDFKDSLLERHMKLIHSVFEIRDRVGAVLLEHGRQEPAKGDLDVLMAISFPLPHPPGGHGLMSDAVSDSKYEENVYLPIAMVYHAQPGEPVTSQASRARMGGVAAVEFLSAVGIRGQPVFGLVTSGPKVSILFTWKSKTSEDIYIFDDDIVTWDISEPFGCFRFCMFLLRLSREARRLREIVNTEGTIEKSFTQTDDNPIEQWTVEYTRSLSTHVHTYPAQTQ
ncbi:hypothetical protein H0H87_009305 [Tephrocybe sp. NHM501043]|nr:hypothetical protein H0H87_009305 [Tephrocybe sp. NHM501043]